VLTFLQGVDRSHMSFKVLRTLEQLATVVKDTGEYSTLDIRVQRSATLRLLCLGKVVVLERGWRRRHAIRCRTMQRGRWE